MKGSEAGSATNSVLPMGWSVRLADDTTVLDGGEVLVGGSPLSSVRLKGAAARALSGERTLTVTDDLTRIVADRLLSTSLALPDLDRIATPDPGALTVVIPVRDRTAQLDRCLSALHEVSCLVVDDASNDPASVASVARRHGARVLALETNGGPAVARNAGLAAVDTPYVAFVDSDVQVTPRALLMLARHLMDPKVVLVGPRVLGRSRTSRPRWFERYERRSSSLTLGRRSGVVRPGAGVAWLPSACLVARTDAIAGGFDASMRVGEDVDLVWRLTDAGHRVRYDAEVEAWHDTRSTVRHWLGRKAYYGFGSASLAERHGDKVAPAVLSPAYAIAAGLVLVRSPLAPVGVALAIADGARRVQHTLPDGPGSRATAGRIASRGMVWAVRQESALLLRHWWPAAAVGLTCSRTTRRATVTALLVDLLVMVSEVDDLPPTDLPAHVTARRLDDVAYGAGLWCGALRQGSAQALRVRWLRTVRSAQTP
jgi:mycofactocin system glycosyltransferase